MFEGILEFMWHMFPFRLNKRAIKSFLTQKELALPRNNFVTKKIKFSFISDICSLPILCTGEEMGNFIIVYKICTLPPPKKSGKKFLSFI